MSVLLRRWYVLVVGMLLVCGGLAAVVAYVPTAYQATARVLLLLPPLSTGANNPTNPYLNLQPGLTTTATLIASDLGSPSIEREMAEDGFTSSYAIGVAPDTGPLLVVTVEDTDPQRAVETRDEVIRRLDAQLEAIQADLEVPDNQYIYSRQNLVSGAEVLPGSKVRAAAALGGMGVVLTVLAAFLFERLARRRRTRRDAAAAVVASAAAVPDDETPALSAPAAAPAPAARPDPAPAEKTAQPAMATPNPAATRRPGRPAKKSGTAGRKPSRTPPGPRGSGG